MGLTITVLDKIMASDGLCLAAGMAYLNCII